MPLTRALFNQIIETLTPHVITEPERQTLIQRAFYGEPIVTQLTYSGQAVTFATNCVERLRTYNDDAALVQLLHTLRDHYVGGDRAREIETIVTELVASVPTEIPMERRGDKPALALASHLFISYARKDLDFVTQLRTDLKERRIPYWIDREGLAPGTPNWERAIRAAIRDSSAVLWVVSPSAYDSVYVDSELAVAEMHHRHIYPVWAAGDNWIACVPLGKHSIQYADMRGERYQTGLGELLAALSKADSALAMPVEAVPILPTNREPRNPYKGLAAFRPEDAGDFFGRTELVNALAARLQVQLTEERPRFLAVLGPSGAGKSSVVMAGLLPALQKGAIPGSESWRFLPPMVPGTHPVERLAGALSSLMPTANPETVLTKLLTMGLEYLSIAFDLLPAAHVILYIDQFEELFTLTADDAERQRFISLLAGAATDPKGKLIVLVTMRADFLDYPLNNPQLAPLFNAHNELVQPMRIAELRDAILKPAQLPDVGLTFDEELVGDIVFALRGQGKALEGALPLVQFTLERLFAEREGLRLTRSAYQRMGGVEGAIGAHCEAVFAALAPVARAKLGKVFLPLMNIDESSGTATRRRAPLKELVTDGESETLVKALIQNRLLQTGREDHEGYVEIVHEALFRSWERLRNWIAEAQEDLILLRQVRAAADEWTRSGLQDAFRWPAERLTPVYAMLERQEPTLNEVERDFIEPEQARLLREIDQIATDHKRRRWIGERLAGIGDTRSGIGVDQRGLPQIDWLPVAPGGEITIENQNFTVKPFYVAKYLVTFAQFQAFLDAPDGFVEARWWQGFPDDYIMQEVSAATQQYANYPRDSVSWYQAVAFTRWLDAKYHEHGLFNQFDTTNWQLRLPTEWEWQWMAQHGTGKRKYPWGDWDEHPRANTTEAGIGDRATAVGMYPDGAAACGALDVAGNLWEWCLNKREKVHEHLIDASGDSRVLRGGAFDYFQIDAAASSRSSSGNPNHWNFYYGFRVVVGPLLAPPDSGSLISEASKTSVSEALGRAQHASKEGVGGIPPQPNLRAAEPNFGRFQRFLRRFFGGR